MARRHTSVLSHTTCPLPNQASLDWPQPDEDDVEAYVKRNREWYREWMATEKSSRDEL